MILLGKLIEMLVLPPLGTLILVCGGLLLARRWKRSGALLVGGGLVWLLLLSMPACAVSLRGELESYPALTAKELPANVGAIVVLSAEMSVADEYGGDTIGPLTLTRVRYGAWLHRATGVPLLTTGGVLHSGHEPLGSLMARALRDEFRVPVCWEELESRNTAENASLSREILRADGVDRIFLVTNGYHMPRAKAAFEAVGFDVVPAPTGVVSRGRRLGPRDFLPRASGLLESTIALHERIGRLWYRVRGEA